MEKIEDYPEFLDWDIERLSNKIAEVFNVFLCAIKFPHNIEFRSVFTEDSINKIPETPILAWKIKKTEPAAIVGEPFGNKKERALNTNGIINTPDSVYKYSKQHMENVVAFSFHTNDIQIMRDLTRNFRNFIIGMRQELRESLSLPDIYFLKRTEDSIKYVDGNIICTSDIEVYIKTLVIVAYDINLIREVKLHMKYEDQ